MDRLAFGGPANRVAFFGKYLEGTSAQEATHETFAQLDELLASLAATAARA